MKKLVKDYKTIAVVCNQWGDTGKGKFVDFLGDWADIVARGTGGANAGHTICIGKDKYIFHLLPSGIIHDGKGTINIIGSGVAFDPRVTLEEIDIVKGHGLSYGNLMISQDAKLVLPIHLLIDRLKESRDKIGTTGRGIGPVYTDHVSRKGLIVKDMLNKDIFERKLRANIKDKLSILKGFKKEMIKEVLDHEHLLNGVFYDEENLLDIDKIIEVYSEYAEFFKNMIDDTDEFVRQNLGNKKLLLEGAQGLLLSVDYGGYPFVTSSDSSIEGLAKGVGLNKNDVDLTLGITKAFFMTRVGEGPFPTELGGLKSAEWCRTQVKTDEEKEYSHTTVNSEDEFEQGIGIRFAGSEYGATTGRPRRTGWLDLPVLKYATRINGPNLVLTKLDVLDDCNTIRLCTKYEYMGEDYNLGKKTLKKGDIIKTAYVDTDILKNCKPIYKDFPGWKSDTTNISEYEDLPQNLKDIIDYVEKECNVNVLIASVGPKRNQTIIR